VNQAPVEQQMVDRRAIKTQDLVSQGAASLKINRPLKNTGHEV
jgi:hypothetical protein